MIEITALPMQYRQNMLQIVTHELSFMLYLYIGYLLTQIYTAYSVIAKTPMSLTALVFSIVVFLSWSFLPVLGFALGKMLRIRCISNSLALVMAGVLIGLLEKALFALKILSSSEQSLGVFIVALLFFSISLIPHRLFHATPQRVE